MSRKRRRNVPQPSTTRRQALPAGATIRPIAPMVNIPFGQAQMGSNTVPVDVVQKQTGMIPGRPRGMATTFLPGDPVVPTPGLDDGQGGPRSYQYPIGGNIVAAPRASEMVPFDILRSFARDYQGIGLCLEAINRIITRLEMQITPKAGIVPPTEDATDPKWLEPAKRMVAWFEDGPTQLIGGPDLHGWLIALMNDLNVLDAGAIYHAQTRGGYLDGLHLIDGVTIQPLVDVAGRVPQPPYPAYRQVLYGAPGDWFTAEQLDYLHVIYRTESLYGVSPIERVLLSVNLAIRLRHYDLAKFTDGATPSGIFTSAAAGTTQMMSPEQLLDFERRWNNMLAGNTELRVRTKFAPPGWTFQSTQIPEITTALDEYLLSETLAAYGLTKDEIGFTDTSNKSVGQSQENVTYRNAVKPKTDYLARLLTRIIRRYDGQPIATSSISTPKNPTRGKGAWDARYQVGWGGIEEPEDFQKKVASTMQIFQGGLFSKLQAKRYLKLPIDQGEEDVPAFITPQGGPSAIVVLADIEKQRELNLQAEQTKQQTAEAGLAIQQKQGDQLDFQLAQAKQQQSQGSDQNPGEGGDNEEPPEGPDNGGGNGSGGQDQGESQDEGGQEQDQDDESATPEDQGSAPPVSKGRRGGAQRMQEVNDAHRTPSTTYGPARPVEWADDGRGRAIPRRDADAVGPALIHADAARSGTGVSGVHGLRDIDRDSSLADSVRDAAGTRDGGSPNRRDDRRGALGERGTSSRTGTDADGSRDPHTLGDEWAAWREKALRAAKRGVVQPAFAPVAIPQEQHAWVAERLNGVMVPDAVRAVFDAQRTHPSDCRCLVCGCGRPGDDHGRPEPVRLPDEQPKTGIMVALFVPASIGQQLALPPGEGVERAIDMHCTLAMLGDIRDDQDHDFEDHWDADAIARLQECVKACAATHTGPIAGRISGIGRFSAPEGRLDPVYASVDCPDLPTFREDLVAEMEVAGFSASQEHGFTPHITLAYVPKDAPMPVETVPLLDVTFPDLWLAVGDRRWAYPLGNAAAQTAVVDELRALRAEVLRAIDY